MFMHHRLRRWTHWVTLVALVLAALAPGLSQAWSGLRGDSTPDWGQVCAAMDLDRMAAPQPGSDPAQAGAHQHCTMCLLRLDVGAPPPAPAAMALRADLAHGQPVSDLAPAVLRPVWAAASARAPPSQA
jgi:hypothetical protein